MKDVFLLSRQGLFDWVTGLTKEFCVFGPVSNRRGQIIFEKIHDPNSLKLDYCSTMTSPRNFIYPSHETLLKIDQKTGGYETVLPENTATMIFAIHPCDMHAITVLDRTFHGEYTDVYYSKRRQETFTVVLNCNRACDQGFCSSMGTGPFIQLKQGFDIVLTDLSNNFILEYGSERGKKLLEKAPHIQKAGRKDFAEKTRIETNALKSFDKHIETRGLVELLLSNLDHPVYKDTADSRCLGCNNCTLVCPTCYCYNLYDDTSVDLKTTKRNRRWDSCLDLNFARVHDGNFRAIRSARLRQFVIHKLATWIEQFDCFGCIGCGRCMTWCPTGIDLTEMAKQIQHDAEMGRRYDRLPE